MLPPALELKGIGYTRAAVAVALTLSFAACGGGDGRSPNAPPPQASVGGLDQRPDNATCVAPERPGGGVSLAVSRVFGNLSFSSPIAMKQAPQDPSRWFVVEQGGRVLVFANQPDVATASPFIDITSRVASGGEAGLLGMAFHPNFPADPRVFLSYTTQRNGPLQSIISEFQTTDGGATLDAASERVLLTINQPEPNHNGGNIAFGPDGFLYIGIGDGGGGGDGHGAIGNGQNLQTLLGKMLRIDVNATSPGFNYAVPADNPFAGSAMCGANGTTSAPSCAEIYAYGFRNPWRWSFDRAAQTPELWLGDVGQGAWEEVDHVTRGGNYGWRCREGAHPFNSNCGSAQNLIDPVAEYGRSAGFSITGGYVYRGSAIPSLHGSYVFGDFGSGNIWHIALDTAPTLQVTGNQAFASGLNIASFAEGLDGELYVVDLGGTLHQLQQGSAAPADSVPNQLSATGCVDPANPAQAASGLIPYRPNAGFWSDGADKERWIGLPNGRNIGVNSDGDWDFPAGTVLMKNFRIGQRLIETRLFMRHPDGAWAGYSYEWNAEQTDATRVVGGKSVSIDDQTTWIFPSEAQCLACHTAAAGRSLGLETAQLNGDFTYSQTGRTANQLTTLNAIQTLTPPLNQDPATLPALPDPFGSGGTLAERARAYLHTNCAQCHRPDGPTPVALDLRYTTLLSATGACDAPPQTGDLGIADARIIAPGGSARSVLLARMNRRDESAMPPLASTRVDEQGVALVASWIDSLTTCN